MSAGLAMKGRGGGGWTYCSEGGSGRGCGGVVLVCEGLVSVSVRAGGVKGGAALARVKQWMSRERTSIVTK